MGLDQSVNAQATAVAQTRTQALAQSILTALQGIQPTLLSQVSDSQATSLAFLNLASIEAWLQPYIRDLYSNAFQTQATTLLQGANLAATAPVTGP